jgi:RHS repeat-associated protein
MRQGSTLSYLFADQLGSTSVVANSSGSKTAEVRYKAWGEDRYTSGTAPTSYRYTGQRIETTIGLYYYGARWYDPALGRFVQADTIIANSGNPQAWDRYAYVNNNPVNYVDPSGHCWGVASAIRGIPSYDTTCNNLDMALSIIQHPEASVAQKVGAGAYIAAEGLAHGVVALGTAALACGAVAPCATAVEAALGIGTSVWKLDPFARGWAIEKIIGRGSLLRNLPGFPTIDRFENGIATSIKSIDLGTKTYQNTGALTSQVQGYIDELAGFTGDSYGGVTIYNAMIRGRELILAIPRNASAEQMKALQQLAAAAVKQGVNLVLKVIK